MNKYETRRALFGHDVEAPSNGRVSNQRIDTKLNANLIEWFKGAERKTRDEERRAAKRKMAASGRNKRLEELYHSNCERSEFYHMADLMKHPALFTPDDHDKVSYSAVRIHFSPIRPFDFVPQLWWSYSWNVS